MSPVDQYDGFVLEPLSEGESTGLLLSHKERSRRSYLNNRAKVLERCHERYRQKKEYISAYNKKLYQKNKEKRIKQCLEWSRKNRDKRRKACREWYSRNREQEQERSKKKHAKTYAEKREYVLRKNREWTKRNPALMRVFWNRRKQRKMQAVGNLKIMSAWMVSIRERKTMECYYCGKVMPGNKVQFDHVIPLSRGGAHSVENLCCTCKSCNSSKYVHLPSEWKRIGQLTMDF